MDQRFDRPAHLLPTLDFITACGGGLVMHTPVDTTAPIDPRERAICRALLLHALALLDASEFTSDVARAAEPQP